MNARDELAQLIASTADEFCMLRTGDIPIATDHAAADAILAAGYTKPRTITTVEELDALPEGSVVLAQWADKSQDDYQMMRCSEGAASVGGGYGLAGGSHWLEMADWGAELTVLFTPVQS